MNAAQHAARRFLTLPLALSLSAVAGGDMPKAPLIDHARVVTVANQIRVNGVPTTIQKFLVAQRLADVEEFYRRAFGDQRVERDLAGWHVIARRQGDYFLTIRMKSNGEQLTEGTTTVANLAAGASARGRPLGVALPADTHVISDLDMDDPGRHSRLIAAVNKTTIAANAEFFRTMMANQHWQLDRDLPTPTGAKTEGRSLWFSAPGKEAMVVLSRRAEATGVVLNLTDLSEIKP